MQRADAERRARHSAFALFRAVRSAIERTKRANAEDVARVLRAQLSRPGRPASRLPPRSRDDVLRSIDKVTEGVDLADQRALFEMCVAAARIAWSALPTTERYERTPRTIADDDAKLSRASVIAEWPNRGSDDDLVRSALTRALRERRRSTQGTARVDVRESDPLRDLFDLPSHGKVRLPRNDMRVHLTRAQRKDGSKNPLPDLLRKAARFSERTLRPALGEELWGLCRPVGFSDRRERLVSVQVGSSALAQEVSLRKRELIRRLNAVPGFERVRDVRFVIQERPLIELIGTDGR